MSNLRPVSFSGKDPFRLTTSFSQPNGLRTAAGNVGQVAICVDGWAVEPGLRGPGREQSDRRGDWCQWLGTAFAVKRWYVVIGEQHAALGQAIGESNDAAWDRVASRARLPEIARDATQHVNQPAWASSLHLTISRHPLWLDDRQAPNGLLVVAEHAHQSHRGAGRQKSSFPVSGWFLS